ncbi:hypothetical protein C8R43DRAFT_1041802 [Mycena crocata]|nr:hypothetical protein C8R43DRAFT_1041802 [Mycena crocata]
MLWSGLTRSSPACLAFLLRWLSLRIHLIRIGMLSKHSLMSPPRFAMIHRCIRTLCSPSRPGMLPCRRLSSQRIKR